jgi:flagellar biosynthesis/type III secretory pathway chaperone
MQKKKIIALNIISDVDQAIKTHLIDHPIEPSEQVIFNEQESAVKKLLNQCKHQNKVNGQIINSSQIAINRFKKMMQKSLKNQSATYDSKGLTNLSNTSIGLKA